MPKWFRRLDRWFDTHHLVLCLLLVMTVLRLPNFFEPYWYGDEGIYLTIGTALRMGKTLYLQIIDHKTPLIYLFAMVPSQLWFRAVNYVAAVSMVILFHRLSTKLLRQGAATVIAGLAFVLLTTLPALEGNIPNGELFVMFFVLWGLVLLFRTHRVPALLDEEKDLVVESTADLSRDLRWFFGAGILFGLGILTKVPAVFDLLAAASLLWFVWSEALWQWIIGQHRPNIKMIWQPLLQGLVLVAGVGLPIVVSVGYFFSQHAQQAYLDYGLLYNFRYSAQWQLNLGSPLLSGLFTLPGKGAVLAAALGILTLINPRVLPRGTKFVLAWLGLTFFAALLSNRPYPHYLLQVVPPLALLLGMALDRVLVRTKGKSPQTHAVFALLSGGFVFVIVSAMLLLQVKFYPTFAYYARFAKLATGQLSWFHYAQEFDGLVKENYQTAKYFEEQNLTQGAPLFIWGTNPTLYALTQTIPVGRFTVLFHIRDFQAEAETIADFAAAQPRFAVIMRGEELPAQLELLLHRDFAPILRLEHSTVWKRLSIDPSTLATQQPSEKTP